MSYVPLTFDTNNSSSDNYSTRIDNLQQKKDDKLNLLGDKSKNITSSYANDINPAEMTLLLGTLMRDRQLSPDSNKFLYSEGEYTGPTGRFYMMGTNREDQPSERGKHDIKPGIASDHRKDSIERYKQFPPGPEGVNINDVYIDQRYPEVTSRTIEALIKGNTYSKQMMKDLPFDPKGNKERFGSGFTEILSRANPDSMFGDMSLWPEITPEREAEIISKFKHFENKMFKEMYPDSKAAENTFTTKNTPKTISSQNGFDNLRQAILQRESAGDYKVTNQLGYVGGYQFGAQALETLGYLKKGASKQGNKALNNPDNWSGKNGIGSVDDFKNSPSVQDQAFKENAEFNLKQLKRLGTINENSTQEEIGGYLAASHLLGVKGAQNLESTDANNTSGLEYFNIGSNAISGAGFNIEQPATEPSGSLSFDERVAAQREQRLRREVDESPVLHEIGQTVKAVAAGAGKGALDLVDSLNELATLLPQEAYNAITGKNIDIDLYSDEAKESHINSLNTAVGYYQDLDSESQKEVDNLISKSGFNFFSPDTWGDLKNEASREFLYDAVLEYVKNPSLTAHGISQLFGGGGALSASTKVGTKLLSKISPKIESAVTKALKSDVTKINDEVKLLIKNGRLSEAEALKNSIKVTQQLGHLVKGTSYTNADWAIRVNDHITQFKENNNGEDPSLTKLASVLLIDRVLSSAEVISAKNILGLDGKLKPAVAKGLRAATSKALKLFKDVPQEMLQEGLDAIGEVINTQYGADKYKNLTITELLKENSNDILSSILAGGAGGAHMSTAGSIGTSIKSIGSKATNKVKEGITKANNKSVTEEEFTVEDTPAKEGFDSELSYALNTAIVSGDDDLKEALVNRVKERVGADDYLEALKNADKENVIESAKEVATVLGYSDDTDTLDSLTNKVTEATGKSKEEVESILANSFAESKALAELEVEDVELGKMLRQASNLRKAGELSKNPELVKSIRNASLETEDSRVIGVASTILGRKIEQVAKEAEPEKKTTGEVVEQAREASKAKAKVNDIIDDVEKKNYVLGSNADAVAKIVELDSVDVAGSKDIKRVESTIKAIADQYNIDDDMLKLIRTKDAIDVEVEATIGKGGYETYGNILKQLEDKGQTEGPVAEQAAVIRAKLESFLESQEAAKDALEVGIKDAFTEASKMRKERRLVNGITNFPTTFMKSNKQPFTIGINSRGYVIDSQVLKAKELIATKEKNIDGIKKALGQDTTTTDKEPTAVKAESKKQVKETKPADTSNKVKPAIKATGKTSVAKKTIVQPEPGVVSENKVDRKELLIDAMRFAIDALGNGENDQDIISGLMKKLPKEVAERVLTKAKKEDAIVVTKPKEVMNEVLSDSLYKAKKAFSVVKGKAKLTSEEPAKGTTGVIQRNPNEYIKVARETTLNTVREFNGEVNTILDKAKETLSSIIKPLHEYEKRLDQYGGRESADSPSRGLLYNSQQQLNNNVVLAIRAALIESLNFDSDLFSRSWKTKDDVARMIGKTNSNDISFDLWELVKDKGVMLDTVGNSLGDKITSILGIAEKDTSSDIQNFARLKADLGGAALQMAVAEGIIEFVSVPATDFAKAMGEEAGSKDANINFVRFKDGDKPSRNISDEYKVLQDNIPEVKENRADIYLDKVPNSVIKKRTTNYHNGKVGLTPSKTHQKALRKLMSTEWEFDRDLALELLENKEAFLRNAGYVDENSDQFKALSYNDKQGQKGKNRKVLNDLEAIENIVNNSKENISLWFEWYATVNQRVMINSNTINPMNDKYGHRWIVQPKGMETTVSVAKKGRGFVFTNKDGKNISKEVRYSLAQAFGMGVDKNSTKNIDVFGNALLRLELADIGNMKERLMADGKFKFTDELTGKEFEVEVEHIGHTLQGLKFLYQAKTEKEFNTKLSAEFDAVTSGFGLKLLQMPIIDNLVQFLAKVGVTIPSKGSKDAKSMNDLLASKKFLDNYETLASEINTNKSYKDILNTIKEKDDIEAERLNNILGSHDNITNSKVWGSLKNILPKAIDGEVNKELRNLFKDPFMTFNYSRSINNIKKGLANNIVNEIFNSLAKTRTTDMNPEQVSIAKAINVILGSPYKGVKDIQRLLREKDPSTIKVGDSNLLEYLEIFVELSYGEEVSSVFHKNFDPFIQAQEVVTNSFKYAYEVFDYEYKKRLDRARKLDGTLTTKNKKDVLRDLLEIFPLIEGPMSEQFKSSFEIQYLKAKEGDVEGNFDDGSLSVFKESRQRGDDILATQFAINGTGSKVINPKLKEFASPGVGGSVLPIHSIDAAILLNTFLGMGDMILIHDAIIPKLDIMNNSVKQYNKHVMEINKNYSFIASINDMVKRVSNFSRNNKDTARDSKHVDWVPTDGDKRVQYTLKDMEQGVAIDASILANRVQNERSKLFNNIKNDPDAKIMHMAGMQEGVYSFYEETNDQIKDEISETFSDTIADMLDNLLNTINKPCN